MAPAARKRALLRGPVSVLYATESMRLTTRLLELASWLMIRRALKAGEISAEEAQVKRERVRLRAPGRPSHVKGFTELPEGLRALIEASFALNDRIVQLDRAMQVVVGAGTADPVQPGRGADAAHRGSLRQPHAPPRGRGIGHADASFSPWGEEREGHG